MDKAPGIDHRTIGGEAFIMTAEDSRIHSLNATASFIFDLCDGTHDMEQIVARVVDEFEIDAGTARSDTQALFDDLLARGMLVQR